MKNTISFLLIMLLLPFYHPQLSAQSTPGVESSNVIFNSAGKDFHDAMPTGNGDIGISMWVEKGGDLLFYISKSDAYDDNNRLLKLGLVKVHISPDPFVADSNFHQQLILQQSAITVNAGSGANVFNMRVWVDANNPVIHVEMKGDKKFSTNVQLQNWRRHEHVMADQSFSDPYNTGFDGTKSGKETIQYPDSILPNQSNNITWFHQNKHSCWPFTLTLQGLQILTKTQKDPLLNNIFGAVISGNNLTQQNDTTLASAQPALTQIVNIVVIQKAGTTPAAWLNALNTQRRAIEKLNLEQSRAAHEKWWKQFWNRSYINIHTSTDTGALITRSYNLQRYLAACGGRGKSWIKYNGSIFTLPHEHDPDFRRWGSASWFQNARLVYWPMITAGDFDMLAPFYSTYLSALPLAEERTKLYYGHKGAFFSETSYAWGTYTNGDYGYNRKGLDAGFATNPYIRRHWSGGLELTAMMLQQYQLTGNTKFVTDTLLPIATEVVQFYNEHYKRGSDGKILFTPAQSLETWQTATNPMPEIAGLNDVLQQLLQLPQNMTTVTQRNAWKKTLHDLPVLPMKTTGDTTVLLPAAVVTQSSNVENPELYAVFPFRLFGVGKPSLDIAKNSFAVRINRESRCWYQDDAQAAYLGLTNEAAKGVTKRMTDWNTEYKFPAMWGPGNDELPDLDHGGVGQMTLQAMLMQTEKDKILLFPAWPKTWDVTFKLLAPHQTIIEAELKDGKLQKLVVTPAARRKDITVMNVD